MKVRLTISTRDVINGDLPPDATGVYWTDTDWTECIDHLTDWSWKDTVDASDELTGVVLTGDDVACDACSERDRQDGQGQ